MKYELLIEGNTGIERITVRLSAVVIAMVNDYSLRLAGLPESTKLVNNFVPSIEPLSILDDCGNEVLNLLHKHLSFSLTVWGNGTCKITIFDHWIDRSFNTIPFTLVP